MLLLPFLIHSLLQTHTAWVLQNLVAQVLMQASPAVGQVGGEQSSHESCVSNGEGRLDFDQDILCSGAQNSPIQETHMASQHCQLCKVLSQLRI